MKWYFYHKESFRKAKENTKTKVESNSIMPMRS